MKKIKFSFKKMSQNITSNFTIFQTIFSTSSYMFNTQGAQSETSGVHTSLVLQNFFELDEISLFLHWCGHPTQLTMHRTIRHNFVIFHVLVKTIEEVNRSTFLLNYSIRIIVLLASL